MIYKTLIIFDSNGVWHTDYANIKLGGGYDEVYNFITKNNLQELIHVAIPEFVLEEIKKQQIEEFYKDVKEHKRISKRFEKLGIRKKLSKTEFTIVEFVEDKMKEYIESQDLKIIDLLETTHAETLKKIIARAINKDKPFIQNKKHSDMGFKDVLIWETILSNRDLLLKYDDIFFSTDDGGFNECKKEFEQKIGRNFEQITSNALLIEKLGIVYSILIENNQIYSFTQTDYFKEMVGQEIDNIGMIEVSDEDREVEDWEMLEPCIEIEKTEFTDQEGECFVITSSVQLVVDGKSRDYYAITTLNGINEIVEFSLE